MRLHPVESGVQPGFRAVLDNDNRLTAHISVRQSTRSGPFGVFGVGITAHGSPGAHTAVKVARAGVLYPN